MLNSVKLSDKTYEELMAEAVAQIPLYSSEWTNFNVSDPGMTLLQNLTAFQLLQQEAIDQVPEEVRRKLLKLVGCTARDNRAASILVQAPTQGGPILPEGYCLWSGDLPFETVHTVALNPWGLAAVYSQDAAGLRDVTRLLDPETETVAYPFGKKPEPEHSLICLLSGVPEMGEPLRLWFQVAEEELRTPFTDEGDIPAFSRVTWQYWTEDGWQTVAAARDETLGFLRSGCVTLTLEGDLPAQWTQASAAGCALRCRLETADYDRPPRLRALAVHLFPMVQQRTRVRCCTAPGGARVTLRGELPRLGNLLVFCREEENGPYRPYRPAPNPDAQGRFYQLESDFEGVTLTFDPALGPTPWNGADAVQVVCYDEEMIHHRQLGPVYGYDRQVIQLDLVQDVLPDGFLVAVETRGRDGTPEYAFLAPGEVGPDGITYHLRSKEAQLVIDEPGGGGCRLLLAACAVTQGSRGNLRPCAALEQRGGYDGTEVEARYFCPAPGRGGVSYESAEALRLRFSAELHQVSVAVRAEDYEALVRQTPGLCIHKVKAVAVQEKNLVKIAVKPYTEEELPTLSADYLRQLRDFLEPRRMLTTRFALCPPRYVPISVAATLRVRGMAAHAQEEAERLLRTLLDHVNGPQPFGGWVRFHALYQALSTLPFVDGVEALSLFPEQRNAALVGSDIRLEDDSLCYPGTIRLTVREQGR